MNAMEIYRKYFDYSEDEREISDKENRKNLPKDNKDQIERENTADEEQEYYSEESLHNGTLEKFDDEFGTEDNNHEMLIEWVACSSF
jgi:hypothetical protein